MFPMGIPGVLGKRRPPRVSPSKPICCGEGCGVLSDSLSPWQSKYLLLLQGGAKAVEALKVVGISLETFSMQRLNNAAFKAALELVDAGIGSTALDPVMLLKLREAGVGDARAAAYFGMALEEFQAALNGDKELQRIYATGEKRGEAMLQVAQFENAITGDTSMQKHLGEFRLGQVPRESDLYSAKQVGEFIKILEAQLGQSGVTKQIEDRAAAATIDGNVIDAEVEEDGV